MNNPGIGMAKMAEIAGTDPGKPQPEATALSPTITGVTGDERHQLIAEAAYFRAEQRSFAPGYELEDWLNAEAEIEIRLSQIGTNR